MEKLLADVEPGVTVLDPFMGSGTTGIACLRTGHDAILIDQDAEYVKIATKRIKHWDSVDSGWTGAKIESEAEPEEETEEFDLFG